MQNMEGHGQERTACIVVYVCAAAGGSEEIKAQRGAPFCIQALSSLFLFPARLVSSATPSTPPPPDPGPLPPSPCPQHVKDPGRCRVVSTLISVCPVPLRESGQGK